MKTIGLIFHYLPFVISTVVSVENAIGSAKGETKKAVVLGAIQAGAQAAETWDESHVQVVGSIIDQVVDVLNKSGVFQKTVTK